MSQQDLDAIFHGARRHHRLLVGALLFLILCGGVSLTHAQNQNPPDVIDPNTHTSTTAPVITSDAAQTSPPGSPVVDPLLTTGVSRTTADLVEGPDAMQALPWLAAGTGLLLGAGMAWGARGPTAPLAGSMGVAPPWVRPVAQQISQQTPAFWQRLKRTGQAWLQPTTRLVLRNDIVVAQRLKGGMVQEEYSLGRLMLGEATTTQPQSSLTPTPTASAGPSAPPAATPAEAPPPTIQPAPTPTPTSEETSDSVSVPPDDPFLTELEAVANPYERFLQVQAERPDLITHQTYPTDQEGSHTHIVMDTLMPEVMVGSQSGYQLNVNVAQGTPGYPPYVRSFVIKALRVWMRSEPVVV